MITNAKGLWRDQILNWGPTYTLIFNPIPYGISIPAMLPPQLKTCLGVIDSIIFVHTNKPMSN